MRLSTIGIIQSGNNLDALIRVGLSYSDRVGATTSERNDISEFMEGILELEMENDLVSIIPFVGDSEPNKRFDLLNPYNEIELVGATVPVSVPGGVSIQAGFFNGYKMKIKPINLAIREKQNFGIGWNMPSPVESMTVDIGNITLITRDDGTCYNLMGTTSSDTLFSVAALSGTRYFERNAGSVKTYNNNSLLNNSVQSANAFFGGQLQLQVRPGNGGPGIIRCWYLTNPLSDAKRNGFDALLTNFINNLNS